MSQMHESHGHSTSSTVQRRSGGDRGRNDSNFVSSTLPTLVSILFASCNCGPESISSFPVTEARLTDDVWLGQEFVLKAYDGGHGFVAIWPIQGDGGVDLIATINPSRFLRRGRQGVFSVAQWPPSSFSTWFVENTPRGFETVYAKRGGEFRYRTSDGSDVPIVQCPLSNGTEDVGALNDAPVFYYVGDCQLRCQDRAQWFRYVDGGFISSECSKFSGLVVPLSQDRAEFAIVDSDDDIVTLRLDGVQEVVTGRTQMPPDSGLYVTEIFEGGRVILRDGGAPPMWFAIENGIQSAGQLPGVAGNDLIEGFAAPLGAPVHTFALVVKERTEGHLSIIALNDGRWSQTQIQNFAIRHQMIAVGNRYYWVGIRPLPDGGGETWGLTVESP